MAITSGDQEAYQSVLTALKDVITVDALQISIISLTNKVDVPSQEGPAFM